MKGDGKKFPDARSDYRETAAKVGARLHGLLRHPTATLFTESFFSELALSERSEKSVLLMILCR